jgi:hypothetical protein
METPLSITSLDRKEAKRRFISAIDFQIEEQAYDIEVDKQAYKGNVDPTKQRLLEAMLEQREVLARAWTLPARPNKGKVEASAG